MKPARIDASQTTTVAAIHVPMPLIERPSVTSVATINETSVAISATPPSTGAAARRSVLKKNGCMSAKTTV